MRARIKNQISNRTQMLAGIGHDLRTPLTRMKLQTAFILREYEGKSYEEIAVVTNCPVGTVRSRIFRAREEIINYFKENL